MIESGFKKIDFGIKNFHKLKDEFFNKEEKKDSIRELSDKFEKLVEQNRKIKLELNLIKVINKKMIKFLTKEKNLNLKLKNYKENRNNSLFTTRIISTGNRYDIFNDSRSKKINLNINIKNPTYSTSSTINKEKKCLSQENINKKKIINKKLALNYFTRYNNKFFKKKNNLTIKTDDDFNIKNPVKRVFSANTLTNKNIVNINETKEEIYLKNVIDYLKQKNREKDKYIKNLRLSISDEIKSLIWVKNFISKLINEIRYDIDDIKYYLSNDQNNKQLKNELKENEKLLFFCVYFYDNCIKGKNKTKYFINNIHDKERKEELKKENK